MKAAVISLILPCILLCANLAAGDGTVRSWEEVTPAGVFTRHEFDGGQINSFGVVSPGTSNTAPGLLWNYPDSGLYWIAGNVSIGNRGTQVCAVCELNNEKVELFSVFDGNPPVPIWTDSSIYQTSSGYGCSSPSKGDRHVVMYHVNNPDIMNRTPWVHCYTSASATPIWTWSYPHTINYGTRMAVDRDFTIVAIAIYNNNTGMLDLFFLDPDTGVEISSYSQVSKGLRGFDLSADGSTLYFHDGSYDVSIFDIATLSVVHTARTGGSFDSHCISGDGTKFAFGGFGAVEIHEKVGSSWTSHTFSTGSGNYGDEMDFSDDGTTLGFGVTQYSPTYTKCEGYIMDVATKTILSHVTWNSSGTYQDVCVDAAISRDGRYFALGRWGDEFDTNDEVQIIERGSNTPVGSIDTRGSVYSTDISADGQVTVSGGKKIHANVSGKGGDVDCLDLGNEDIMVRGKPIAGGTIDLEVHGSPGWSYIPYRCTGDVPEGATTSYASGTLYLDITPPNTFMLMYVGIMPGAGMASDTLAVPSFPGAVGLTRYVQVVFTNDYVNYLLSKDYVAITILP